MGNYLEAARDLKRIIKLEPDNKPVAEELAELIKKHLSEDDKKILEQDNYVSTDKNTKEPVEEFKRLNIVEDEEEDDDEQEPVVPIQNLVTSGVSSHEIKNLTETPKQTPAQKKEEEIPVKIVQEVKSVPTQQASSVPEANKSVFLKELRKRQDVKQKAVDEIKRSMYENAINLMKKELEYFDEDDIRLVGLRPELKTEYYSLKMSFHANLALCYSQLDLPKKVVEYCDIVLESHQENAKVVGPEKLDLTILEKTLMRKALALEKCEKFRDARIVYNEVRQLFPHNMQASQGIHRCDDFLGDRLIDFSPSSSNLSPAHKNSSPLLEKIPVSETPKVSSQPVPIQPKIEVVKNEDTNSSTQASTSESLGHYEKLKTEGNNAFKKNDFTKAYEIFTKIINSITLAYPDLDKNKDEALCVLLVSVLSNRAMTCAKIGKFYQGIEDCDRILNIDWSNAKAYHRRFVCQEEIAGQLRNQRKQIKEPNLVIDLLKKEREYIEGAMSDLEIVVKHTQEGDYKLKKQELQGIKEALNAELKKLAPSISKPVVEVLNSKEETTPEVKKIVSEPKKTEVPAPQPVQRSDSNLDIDAITLQALDSIISSSGVPNNASKFETELKSFKTHYLKMWQYFGKFADSKFLVKLYDKREMEAAIISTVVNCLSAVLAEE
jgi:tetratricopeptide (TPR) repeat protein